MIDARSDGGRDAAVSADDARPLEGGGAPSWRGPIEPELRNALLDLEEPLADLRSALVALDLIASGVVGIERDDMVGLRFVTKQARDLADVTLLRWRTVLNRVEGGSGTL